jgi:hypothetical protein
MQKSSQKEAKVTKVFLQASCFPFDRAYSPLLFANFVVFCFNSIRFVANAEEFTEGSEGNEEKTVSAESGAVS